MPFWPFLVGGGVFLAFAFSGNSDEPAKAPVLDYEWAQRNAEIIHIIESTLSQAGWKIILGGGYPLNAVSPSGTEIMFHERIPPKLGYDIDIVTSTGSQQWKGIGGDDDPAQVEEVIKMVLSLL